MPLARHVRAIFTLGLPLIGSNLAQMLLNVTDTVMVGWYGVEALAALVLGTSYFFSIFMLGNGIALAVMGRVSASLGADDEVQARRDTRMGIWLSILFGVAMLPVFWNSGAVLEMLGQKPEIAALAQDYLRILGFALAPGLAMMVIRSYLSAQERTAVLLWITLGAVLLNAGVNWILIFGNWGAPELGAEGCGLATAASMWISTLIILLYVLTARSLRPYLPDRWLEVPDWGRISEILIVGFPVGLTFFLETGVFSAITLLIATLGDAAVAAHQIAIN
ncbi:MATE family efflux transporter, partial [Thioclava sp.]|uniref:MATE family efflux transporter n=1 Tax=Thioclava sp. TaxID=1933450 RepID=UPI003242CCF3